MPPLPSLESFQQKCIQNNEIIDVVLTGDRRSSTLKVSTNILNSLSATFVLDIARVRLEQGPLTRYYDSFILYYDDDDPEAWQLLLYWAHHRRLPLKPLWEGDHELLIHAWILGQAHDIPAFQDDVMIELLFIHCCVDLCHISTSFAKTPEDSPLCRVLVEEVVYQHRHAKVLAACELDELAQSCGFTGVFAAAMEQYGREGSEMFHLRFPKGGGEQRWLEYMVEKEGKRGWQWVHDEKECGMRVLRYEAS